MQNPMYGMPNYSFQSPFGNGMNTSYQNQQLPHYDIVKVNGRNGAEAFQMGPNSQVLLLDETAPVLWLASTDGAGYKTVSAFDISPHQDQQQTIAAQQAQISQLQLAQQMNNVVRYPNGFTYNAGMSPFCGGCCSGC